MQLKQLSRNKDRPTASEKVSPNGGMNSHLSFACTVRLLHSHRLPRPMCREFVDLRCECAAAWVWGEALSGEGGVARCAHVAHVRATLCVAVRACRTSSFRLLRVQASLAEVLVRLSVRRDAACECECECERSGDSEASGERAALLCSAAAAFRPPTRDTLDHTTSKRKPDSSNPHSFRALA